METHRFIGFGITKDNKPKYINADIQLDILGKAIKMTKEVFNEEGMKYYSLHLIDWNKRTIKEL